MGRQGAGSACQESLCFSTMPCRPLPFPCALPSLALRSVLALGGRGNRRLVECVCDPRRDCSVPTREFHEPGFGYFSSQFGRGFFLGKYLQYLLVVLHWKMTVHKSPQFSAKLPQHCAETHHQNPGARNSLVQTSTSQALIHMRGRAGRGLIESKLSNSALSRRPPKGYPKEYHFQVT